MVTLLADVGVGINEAPAYTIVADTAAFARHERSRRRQIVGRMLGTAQAAALGTAETAARIIARPGTPRLERPMTPDAELAATELADDCWTISGADAWDWFVGSGTLEALEIPGPWGCRALVRSTIARGGPILTTSVSERTLMRPARAGEMLRGPAR